MLYFGREMDRWSSELHNQLEAVRVEKEDVLRQLNMSVAENERLQQQQATQSMTFDSQLEIQLGIEDGLRSKVQEMNVEMDRVNQLLEASQTQVKRSDSRAASAEEAQKDFENKI